LANKWKLTKNDLPKLANSELPRLFEKAVLKSTIIVSNAVKRKLSGQRSGKMYKVPATNRTYQASAPFEPPAVRLGHLRNSYIYTVDGTGFAAKGTVGSGLEYSHYLEYGTYKIQPRPHLVPSFRESKNDVYKQFEGLL